MVTGFYGDGNDCYVRITDPWDRDLGSPGMPGSYLNSHATGSRYIMRWADFVAEYEAAATNFSKVNLQILHSGGTFDQSPNTGGSKPTGYAMAYAKSTDQQGAEGGAEMQMRLSPPPPPRARALSEIDLQKYIDNGPIEVLRGSRGNISWALDQLHSAKHLNNVAPAPSRPFSDAPTIKLEQWPVLHDGTSNVSAFFAIDWSYDGHSLSDIRISNTAVSNGTMALDVRAEISDDVPPNALSNCAVLKIKLTYKFQVDATNQQAAITTILIYGDGTHEIASQWQPSGLLAHSQSANGKPSSRSLGNGRADAIAVVGIAIGAIQHNEGGVTWSLDAFNSVKHPNDVAPNPSPAFRDAMPITIGRQSRGWVDKIGTDFQVDWQYNGTSVSNIKMKNIWKNDALLANLDVRGTIAHDNNVYDHRSTQTDVLSDGTVLSIIPGFKGADNPNNRQPCSAMRVTFDMSWDEQFSGTSKIQVEIHLFGDGFYSQVTREIQ